VRHDFLVDGEQGIRLAVREVTESGPTQLGGRAQLLLVHGARVPGVASFDLEVPGGSLPVTWRRAGSMFS